VTKTWGGNIVLQVALKMACQDMPFLPAQISTNNKTHSFFQELLHMQQERTKNPNSEAKAKGSEPMGICLTKDKDHRCPWNFKGSKSMELQGTVALIMDLYNSGIAFAAKLVRDDDCSTKANVWHSFKELINQKIWADKQIKLLAKEEQMLC